MTTAPPPIDSPQIHRTHTPVCAGLGPVGLMGDSKEETVVKSFSCRSAADHDGSFWLLLLSGHYYFLKLFERTVRYPIFLTLLLLSLCVCLS